MSVPDLRLCAFYFVIYAWAVIACSFRLEDISMLCALLKVILDVFTVKSVNAHVFMIAMKHLRHGIVVEGLEKNLMFNLFRSGFFFFDPAKGNFV